MCYPPDDVIVKQIKKAAKDLKLTNVFVATDSPGAVTRIAKKLKQVWVWMMQCYIFGSLMLFLVQNLYLLFRIFLKTISVLFSHIIMIGQCACFEDIRVLKSDRKRTPLDSCKKYMCKITLFHAR